ALIDLHRKFLRGVPGGRRLNLSSRDASTIDFRNRRLNSAELVGARLQYAKCNRAALSCAHLFGADLEGASLRFANLSKADLRGASMRRANFDSANLEGADIRDAVLVTWTQDEGLRPARGSRGTVIEETVLANANLSG